MTKWLNGLKVKPLFIIYYLLFTILFLYSYTQVDLGLTLTRISFWQTIQRSFQYIGYFNRPLSTAIYLILLAFLFTFYIRLLSLVKKRELTSKQFWWLVGIASVILVFSYNAFSYDLFNYMFDAKIFTVYGLNPYQHKALDFPNDPFLAFMHWTHRNYPYGPIWLSLTIPLSFLGMQKFLLTLYLFKTMVIASLVGTVYFIGKITEKINPSQKLISMSFFAFNPLVIIESLVSAHNETVMMFFLLWAIYLLLEKKYFWAWVLFSLSVGVKFATAFFLPIFAIVTFLQLTGRKINWKMIFSFGAVLMALSMIPASFRTEMQPWYFLYVLPLLVLFPQERALFLPGLAVSLGLLLHYVPFLYTGNWDPPIPIFKFWLNAGLIAISAIFALIAIIVSGWLKPTKMLKF